VSRTLLAAVLAAVVVAPHATAAQRTPRPSPAARAPTKTLDAAGVRLGYRAFGKGRPIVFVQGLGGSIDGWDPRFLDAVAKQGRRVVVFDNEGVGRSRMRKGELTVRRMADDAAALIRKLKLRRPDVFGWSMGGMIAQSLAVRHPRRVRRLVLAATAPGDGKAVGPTPEGLEALTSQDSSPTALLGLLFPPEATRARDTYIRNLLLRRDLAPAAPKATIDAQLIASGNWLAGNDPDGARVARLKHPVLVGGGEHDEALPAPNQRHLARRIRRARLVMYDDASHGFYLQHRRDFLRRLDRFLG
jgi:pimeloyl-ACP methyl ester carboxylesterase